MHNTHTHTHTDSPHTVILITTVIHTDMDTSKANTESNTNHSNRHTRTALWGELYTHNIYTSTQPPATYIAPTNSRLSTKALKGWGSCR